MFNTCPDVTSYLQEKKSYLWQEPWPFVVFQLYNWGEIRSTACLSLIKVHVPAFTPHLPGNTYTTSHHQTRINVARIKPSLYPILFGFIVMKWAKYTVLRNLSEISTVTLNNFEIFFIKLLIFCCSFQKTTLQSSNYWANNLPYHWFDDLPLGKPISPVLRRNVFIC